jgi:hypothetical protein
MRIFILCLIIVASSFSFAESGSSGNVIVNIYNNRPEQRTQSRWNLFDWMRTKEKIKTWDMWLEHNSTKNFLPEFSLAVYYSFSSIEGARANYYKMNLDSYFLPLKFADFGINLNGKFLANPETQRDTNYSVSGLFRIFGNNVQNTNITVKVGYSHSEVNDLGVGLPQLAFNNMVVGSELQLYLVDNLGLKSAVNYFFKSSALKNGADYFSQLDYNLRVFLEYKAIRLEGGYYIENNTFSGSINNKIKTTGWIAGIQHSF